MALHIGKKKIAGKIVVFKNVFSKAIGLRFRAIKKDHVYIFPLNYPRLSMIDTFFVKSNIDIYFLDKQFKIIGMKKNIRPFRFVFPKKGTCFILEAQAGSKFKKSIMLF